jgi:hypothetical protein
MSNSRPNVAMFPYTAVSIRFEMYSEFAGPHRVPHISFLRCGSPFFPQSLSPLAGCPILNAFFAFRVGLFADSHRRNRVPHISFLRCGSPFFLSPSVPSPCFCGCPILNAFFAFRVGLFAHSHRRSPITHLPHPVLLSGAKDLQLLLASYQGMTSVMPKNSLHF